MSKRTFALLAGILVALAGWSPARATDADTVTVVVSDKEITIEHKDVDDDGNVVKANRDRRLFWLVEGDGVDSNLYKVSLIDEQTKWAVVAKWGIPPVWHEEEVAPTRNPLDDSAVQYMEFVKGDEEETVFFEVEVIHAGDMNRRVAGTLIVGGGHIRE